MIFQFMRFGLVGAVATGVHLVSALVYHHIFGLTPLVANACAFMTAWAVSYFGNWVWTFGAVTAHNQSAPRYLAVALAGFVLNQTIVYITANLWSWPLWAALIPVVMIVPLVNFLASRFWAYRVRGTA